MLKLSGEVLAGEAGYGIDSAMLDYLASEIGTIHQRGVQVGIVIGAGNIFRGVQGAARGIARATGDAMGMLATIMNSLALRDALDAHGIPARLQTAVEMHQVAEPYVRANALAHISAGEVVIFAGGTGHPFFTTDTAAALRAVEIEADAVLKATKVDGVYSADPVNNPTARRFERIRYADVLQQQLRVMDLTAISFCMEHAMPIRVFNLTTPGNLRRIMNGESIGTLVEQ